VVLIKVGIHFIREQRGGVRNVRPDILEKDLHLNLIYKAQELLEHHPIWSCLGAGFIPA
jgi:hypothetical protein